MKKQSRLFVLIICMTTIMPVFPSQVAYSQDCSDSKGEC